MESDSCLERVSEVDEIRYATSKPFQW